MLFGCAIKTAYLVPYS